MLRISLLLGCMLPFAAAAAPDFTHVDVLDGYQPVQVVPGAPGTHPLVITNQSCPSFAAAQAYSDAHGGLAFLVWQKGKLICERYAAGHDENTRFETFSMHKSVIGLVYGAALADGVIHSLDDPVELYVPEWQGDPRGKITLRQLLTMESGLHAYDFADPAGREISAGTHVTESVLDDKQDRPPGTLFDYNNVSVQLAGTILDRALHKAGRGDYAAYLSEKLLKPLGAGDAHLWLEHPGGEPRFFAELQLRARDWLRVGIMIAQGGRFAGRQVLPAAWINAITSPSARNPNYGMLVWIGSPWVRWRAYTARSPIRISHTAPYLAEDLVYFDGFGGERVYVSPARQLVIVRVGQPDIHFDDSIIPNDVVQGLVSVK